MLKGSSEGREERSRDLVEVGLFFKSLAEDGTRGERREGINVVALFTTAGIDLRYPFLGGIVK